MMGFYCMTKEEEENMSLEWKDFDTRIARHSSESTVLPPSARNESGHGDHRSFSYTRGQDSLNLLFVVVNTLATSALL